MALGKKRILVVEDHLDTQEVLSILLKQCDYEVKVASTVAEARQFFSSEDFDLYLLDNLLPDGTGVELCEEIRLTTQSVPIIFLSAAAREAERAQAIAAGAQDYLTKPIELKQLDGIIAELFNEERCLGDG
jgi:DNA-binding response OmpR family regulator